jgi:hypothetical protein
MSNARSPFRSLAWLGCLVLLLIAPSTAAAQAFGVRAGVSASPDQFYFGAHFETAPLMDRLTFRPNLEVGLGDNVTLVAANFEFAYKMPIPRQHWSVYVGGGPAANIYRFDQEHGGGSEVRGGLNILLGVEERRGLFFEMKVGAIDSPNFKFGVGYTWR